MLYQLWTDARLHVSVKFYSIVHTKSNHMTLMVTRSGTVNIAINQYVHGLTRIKELSARV